MTKSGPRHALNASRLRELLAYDVATGEFTWAKLPSIYANTSMLRKLAGGNTPQGYWRIRVDGRIYLAHRLAWMYVYGAEPDGETDHINGNKLDNRIANLRDVSKNLNQQNSRMARANNKSGKLGVSPHNRRWRAQINNQGKTKLLGLFDTPDQAHEAYVEAKRRMHAGCTI